MTASPHETFIDRALELARRAWGETHPNPMVGAVIVEDGRIVAEGWHERAGQPHAEVNALRALGRKPRDGAVLYVTLEPCSTHGRTPPCCDAIRAAGLRHVVVGATDPNPAHAGRGLELLRASGVEVIAGVRAAESEDLNLIFNHAITAKRPLLAAKMALTLDGKMATRTGNSKWITGPEARADVMRWRRLFPAIAVGAGTALADDPALTSRSESGEWCGRRFVLDRRLRVAVEVSKLKLFNDSHVAKTVVVTTAGADPAKVAAIEATGAQVWSLAAENDVEFLNAWRDRLWAEGVTGVWIEGGPTLHRTLLNNNLADYLFAYTAPVIVGDEAAPSPFGGCRVDDLKEAKRVRKSIVERLGEDWLVRGWL